MDNNPFWPAEKDGENRIKFLGGISQLDNLNAPLRLLNGYEIGIAERVSYNLIDSPLFLN